MSCSIAGTTIKMTRGDTLRASLIITSCNGEPYTPIEGDSIRFAMKKTYDRTEPIILKNIPIDSMQLVLNPEDTKMLDYGKYVYDIEITHPTGDVDTFISKASFVLTEEVH